MQKSLKKHFMLFVFPTLAAFLIAFVIPFIMGIYLSFCEFTTVTNAKWVGFSNYVKAFTLNNEFLDAMWFTTKFAVVAVITINLFAFILALMLTRRIKGTNFFRTVFFLPNLIGGIVLGWLWQMILNGILSYFNVTLTYDPKFGFWGLVVLMNWQLIGYMMIIYIAGLQSIPDELTEAALIDGANWWQRLKSITVPLVMPSVTICMFLTVTNSFKLFDQNYALTAGAPGRKTTMLALDIFNTFYNRTGWEGVGQAKAVIFFVVVGVISMLSMYLSRSKEVEQ